MEEKQAELDNPVEGWNLSVKDVRKILSRKHRHRSSDDVIREGDYPDDDDDTDEEEQEVKGRRSTARGEERPTKEPIAEFPISSSSRRTRSSTSNSRDRRQPEHHHHREHHHHHHHHKEHRSSSSSSSSSSAISGVSPVISISPVMLAAAAASVDPSSRTTAASSGTHPPSAAGKKAPPTGTGTSAVSPIIPASAQKPATPIAQPSALPPPHLKTPVTMVISRDPRVAKRQQQQLLEKTQQQGSSTNQQTETNAGSKTGPDSKSPSPGMEASPQKSAESDEARMRERLLLRQKYRIRKASDRRDSKDDSPEDAIIQQSPTAPTSGGSLSQASPPPSSSAPASSAPAPIKSCLVIKGASATSTDTTSNVKTVSPIVGEPDAHGQSSSQQQDQGISARPPPTSNEQGASLHVHPPSSQQQPPPPRWQGFGGSGSVAGVGGGGETVEQCTGELELSPHKKAVFVLDAKSAPIDVTSLTPVHGGSGAGETSGRAGMGTTHEVLSDSRVEPETGAVESMSVSTTPQVPNQASVGTGSSEIQADTEATPTASVEGRSRNEGQAESDEDEKDDSSDSTDDEDRDEREGGAKQEGGVAIRKCYMDREGEEEEMGVASDKEMKEDER